MRTVKIVSAAVTFALATGLHTTSSPASGSLSDAPTPGSPAAESVSSPVSSAVSSLTLTLSIAGGPARSTSLRCDGETPPSYATACGMLRRFGGDPSRMTYDIDMICDEEYVPHTVTASGTWDGRPVSFERTYDNRCEMTALTGPLFSF